MLTTDRLLVALALAILTGLAFPAPARAQFEGVVDIKGTSRPQPGQVVPSTGRFWISPRGARMVWEADLRSMGAQPGAQPGTAAPPMPPAWKMTTLWRAGEPDLTYLLNEEKKAYATMSAKDVESGTQPTEKWTLEKKGRDSVAGLACEKVLLKSSQGTEVDGCVSRELLGSQAWAAAMRSSQRSAGGFMEALRAGGLEGFLIRMTMRPPGSAEPLSTFEVTRAQRQGVPASTFDLPTGYRKVGMMGLWANPEQEKQLQEAEQKLQEQLKSLPPEQRKQMEEMLRKMRGGS
jgi:hypothetical protein